MSVKKDITTQLVAAWLTPPPLTWRDIMGPWKPAAAQTLNWWLPGEQPGRLLPGAPGIGETE